MAIPSNCPSLVDVNVMGCVPFQKTCLGPCDGSRRREQRQNVHCVGTFLLNPHSLCKFGDHSTNGPPPVSGSPNGFWKPRTPRRGFLCAKAVRRQFGRVGQRSMTKAYDLTRPRHRTQAKGTRSKPAPNHHVSDSLGRPREFAQVYQPNPKPIPKRGPHQPRRR